MASTPFDTLPAFEIEARSRGFDEVLERVWNPDTVMDTHTHDFDVWAIVRSGKVALTMDGQTRHLSAGDSFSLDARKPHSEQYGPQGSAFWVARRHGV